MNCIVCYGVIEHEHQCSDIRCKESFCRDCLESLIDFCVDEGILPKCPARDCGSFLTLSDFDGLDKDILLKYYQLCLNYFLKDQGDVIEKQIQEKALLRKHCEDRQKFIQDEFPAGISLMANIAFKSKLKRLEKQKAAVLKKDVKHRSCMNSTCAGFLVDMICSVCQTEFCKQCEKTLDKHHTCKQDDLDSVHFVNNLISCPACGQRIFKNQGCDHVSCACGENFHYSTGESGGPGSKNVKIAVNIDQRYKLTVLYKDKVPKSCLKRLLQLESLEPKSISKDTLLVPVKKYIETKDERMAKVLANKIDAYHQNRFRNRDYQTNMVRLENMLKSEELSQLKFSQQLDKYIEQFSD